MMSRKIYWGKKGRNGMLENWNNGVMEYWSIGIDYFFHYSSTLTCLAADRYSKDCVT
ncbi:MAG: hypothetical protein ACYC49_06400 [Ignavibacteriaceae bacterium]